MGFKTTNYNVGEYGLTVPQSYARISDIHVDMEGHCRATFEIQQTREDIGIKKSFDMKHFSCIIDKEQPIHQQVYEKAKVDMFADWEDDIVQTLTDKAEY